MQLLKIELGTSRYVMRSQEVEKMMAVPARLASAIQLGNTPSFIVVEDKPFTLRDLRLHLLGTPTTLFRGSRLILTRTASRIVLLCEMVTGLVQESEVASDIQVIEGHPYKLISAPLIESAEDANAGA